MDNDLFDLSQLTDRDLGHIEFILTSPSYTRVFRPFLMSVHDSCVKQLLDRTEERRRKISDDSLAERANAFKALVYFFDKIVEEAQTERINLARQGTFDEQYGRLRSSGSIGHSGQKPPEELPIEEDY